MPVYLFWGEDQFAMERAVAALQQQVLDPAWSSFNYDKILPDQPDAVIQALNQAMTPVFGAGSRLVWLVDSTLCQRCPETVLTELERSLPGLPETSVLLLTTASKPDARLKSTKLLQKYAQVREFSAIPGWKTELIVKQVQQAAREVGVKLTPDSIELLAESVGSDTRKLYTELEKLQLFAGAQKITLDATTIATLVTATTQNSLKLAAAIRQGHVGEALDQVTDLLRRNEPALVIVKTLVGQFRTWLWVKLMIESGERNDQAIAQAAEIGNPKRLYFLRKEVEPLSLDALLQALPILLELEYQLKYGGDELSTLQTKVIELCQVL